jgi:hypothetical protein
MERHAKMLEYIKARKGKLAAKASNEDLLGLGSAAAHPARRHTKKRSANHLSHVDDYIVVTSRAGPDDFRSKVREMMALGYHLQGGVSGDAHNLYQALTKKVSSANDLLGNNGDLLHLGAAAAANNE